MAKNYSFFSFFIWIFVCDHYWQYFKIKDILFTIFLTSMIVVLIVYLTYVETKFFPKNKFIYS